MSFEIRLSLLGVPLKFVVQRIVPSPGTISQPAAASFWAAGGLFGPPVVVGQSPPWPSGVAVRAERRRREARPELIGAPCRVPAGAVRLHDG